MDLMDDEIQVFKKRAKELKVSSQIKKTSWKQIPRYYKKESYDFLFCRGNSFIYADGGWNKKQTINKKSSIDSYKKTLKNFYDVLKKGGYLYIDKFPDNEKPHKDVVAQIKVGQKEKEDLIFYTKKIPSKRYREAMMIRRTPEGKETGLPNMTYDLREDELESMMREIGFKVKKINLKSETHFKVWLAKK